MAGLTFYHPAITKTADRPGPYLSIPTGFDEVSWGYRLNTAVYPTYGGEVVQVLSTYIDEFTIQGTLPSYGHMERVYAYFAYFLQIATQGRGDKARRGTTAYNQGPMIMTYPERGWRFKLIVTGAPGFRYGRDVVAPEWRLQCHVVDDDNDLHSIKEFTKATALDRFLKSDGEDFSWKGQIGFRAGNPFSAPGTMFGDTFDPENTREAWQTTSDRYNEIINSYLESDFDQLYETLASRPHSYKETLSGQDEKDAQSVKRGRANADSKKSDKGRYGPH